MKLLVRDVGQFYKKNIGDILKYFYVVLVIEGRADDFEVFLLKSQF
jgi:hypothetical protein